jgi:hypothetical protein
MTQTIPLKMDKVYALCVKAGLLEEAEFIKGLDQRFDVIKIKEKAKRQVKTK